VDGDLPVLAALAGSHDHQPFARRELDVGQVQGDQTLEGQRNEE
jgi:hypothetical protein